MTVSVDIEVAKTLDAHPIPLLGVHGAASLQPWVYKVQGGRLIHQDVVLGLSSAGLVDVLEGLTEGDLVTMDALMPLAATQRVSPQLQPTSP